MPSTPDLLFPLVEKTRVVDPTSFTRGTLTLQLVALPMPRSAYCDNDNSPFSTSGRCSSLTESFSHSTPIDDGLKGTGNDD